MVLTRADRTWGDPNIIGPFNSYEEANIWSQTYPRMRIVGRWQAQNTSSCNAADEEIESWRHPTTDPRNRPSE